MIYFFTNFFQNVFSYTYKCIKIRQPEKKTQKRFRKSPMKYIKILLNKKKKKKKKERKQEYDLINMNNNLSET